MGKQLLNLAGRLALGFQGHQGELYEEDDRLEIGLFIGNDITSLVIANKLIPQIVKAGYKPTIFLPEHRFSNKPEAAQLELQDLSFYERYLPELLKAVIEQMPASIQADGKPHSDTLYTLKQLGALYEVPVVPVENVNDPEFVKSIQENPNMVGGVSIRCYQIWKNPLIDAFTSKRFKANPEADNNISGFAWNAHPGKLPEFRGLFTPLQAMASLQSTFGWTLHEIIYDAEHPHKGIDAGPVIHVEKKAIEYDMPAIDLYTTFGPAVSGMIFSQLEEKMDTGTVQTVSQNQHRSADLAQYYSHPTPEFFEQDWSTVFTRKASNDTGKTYPPTIVIPEAMAAWYTELFTTKNDVRAQAITTTLYAAITDWEENKDKYAHEHEQRKSQDAPSNPPPGVVDSMMANDQTFTDIPVITMPVPKSENPLLGGSPFKDLRVAQ